MSSSVDFAASSTAVCKTVHCLQEADNIKPDRCCQRDGKQGGLQRHFESVVIVRATWETNGAAADGREMAELLQRVVDEQVDKTMRAKGETLERLASCVFATEPAARKAAASACDDFGFGLLPLLDWAAIDDELVWQHDNVLEVTYYYPQDVEIQTPAGKRLEVAAVSKTLQIREYDKRPLLLMRPRFQNHGTRPYAEIASFVEAAHDKLTRTDWTKRHWGDELLRDYETLQDESSCLKSVDTPQFWKRAMFLLSLYPLSFVKLSKEAWLLLDAKFSEHSMSVYVGTSNLDHGTVLVGWDSNMRIPLTALPNIGSRFCHGTDEYNKLPHAHRGVRLSELRKALPDVAQLLPPRFQFTWHSCLVDPILDTQAIWSLLGEGDSPNLRKTLLDHLWQRDDVRYGKPFKKTRDVLALNNALLDIPGNNRLQCQQDYVNFKRQPRSRFDPHSYLLPRENPAEVLFYYVKLARLQSLVNRVVQKFPKDTLSYDCFAKSYGVSFHAVPHVWTSGRHKANCNEVVNALLRYGVRKSTSFFQMPVNRILGMGGTGLDLDTKLEMLLSKIKADNMDLVLVDDMASGSQCLVDIWAPRKQILNGTANYLVAHGFRTRSELEPKARHGSRPADLDGGISSIRPACLGA